MVKREKRLAKIRQNPGNVRYNDLVKVLETIGFTIIQGKGSHVIADYDSGETTISITLVKPHGGKKFVNIHYVKESLKAIDHIIELQDSENNETGESENG